MIEFGSPCVSSRQFLMSHVEIVHPQQPNDVSSVKDTDNDLEKQLKQSQRTKNVLIVKRVNKFTESYQSKKKHSFYSLIKIQRIVTKFTKRLRSEAYLNRIIPKSIFIDYLFKSLNKGNHPIAKFSGTVQFKKIVNIIWEAIFYIANIILVLIMPFELLEVRVQTLSVCQIIFFLDMGIQFVKPFYKEGELIQDRYIIFKNYVGALFMRDFMKLALILASIFNISYEYVEIQLAVDLLVVLFSLSQLHLKFASNNYFVVKILESIFMFVFLCHLFTSKWLHLHEADYLTRLITILDIFLGKSMFQEVQVTHLSYLLIEVTFIFLRIFYLNQIISFCLFNQEKRFKKKELFDLRKHLRNLQVSSTIFNKVISYYKTNNDAQDQSSKLINSLLLKPKLAEELKLQIQGNFLKNYRIFNKFTVSTIKKLICLMENVEFKPNEQILQGEDDYAIYFIQQGKVMITFADSELYTLQRNDVFGDVSFFTGLPRNINAISLGHTKLFKIKRQAYLNAVRVIGHDLETAQMIKDRIIFAQQYDVIQRRCECCQNNNHMIQDCPLLTYRPNKDTLISRVQFPAPMIRRPYTRKRSRYQNVLLNQNYNCIQAQEYQDNNQEILKLEEGEEISYMSDEMKTKQSFTSPDPLFLKFLSQKKPAHSGSGESEDFIRKNKQNYIQPIIEQSQEVQSITSSQDSFQDIRQEEPFIKIVQDTCKSPKNWASLAARQRSQSSNLFEISQIQSIQNTVQKKPLIRSSTQLSEDQKMKKSSTYINGASQIQIFHNDNVVYMEFIKVDLDRMQNFNIYLPNNNMDVVIKQARQVNQQRRSKYTLNYELSKQLRRFSIL